VIGVDDLDRVIDGDVAGGDDTLALLGQGQDHLVAAMLANGHILEVEQDFDDVLLQALEGGVFVQHAVDFHFDDGTAGNRGEQHATQRVAQGMPETALQGLDDDLCAIWSELLDAEAAWPQHAR